MPIDSKLVYGPGDDTSFIMQYFEDFYCEIMRHKTDIIGESEGKDSNASFLHGTSVAPEVVLESLGQLLTTQAIDAARFGGKFASKFYMDAQFVMAALADEVFLHLNWSGKSYWENHLLESKLYNTHNAGQVFFDRMDAFLKTRDPSQADIAMLYLLTLGLGFKGKFRNIDDQGAIAKYRNELYLFINHRDQDLFKTGTHLLPETYSHTLEEGEISYLNDFRPWLAAFASAFLIMLFASYGVWYSATGEIRSSVNNILQENSKNH